MMKIRHILILFSLSAGVSGCFQGSEVVPDQDVWQYALPSDYNISEELLKETDQLIKDGDYEQIESLIILKEDEIIFENYYDFSNRSQLRSIGNGTYTVLISMLGTFIENNQIGSLDDPIAEYLPEYQEVFAANNSKSDITIRHLLTNKSGLVWNESVVTSASSDSDLQTMRNNPDWVKYVLEKPLEAPPGLRLVFNSGHGMILAKIMQNLIGDSALEDYFKEKLFDPIGIKSFDWEKDPMGTLNGTSGLKISSFDYLRFSSIFLNEGRWVNKQRIISEDWFFEMTTITELLSQYYGYGYGWWELTNAFLEPFGIREQRIIFISGDIGQHVYILPDQDLIVLIHAENYFYRFFSHPSLRLFIKIVDATVGSF